MLQEKLLTGLARKRNVPLLPIDSEHNAIHQCLRGGSAAEVRRIWLTASGGPFRQLPADEFQYVTVEQALRHPTWVMGRRITIDSATMLNKGLEIIEACRLFNLPPPLSGSQYILSPLSIRWWSSWMAAYWRRSRLPICGSRSCTR